MPGSWPVPPARNELALPSAERLTPAQTCRLLLRAFDELHSTHPTVAFWWKDEDSTFLGAWLARWRAMRAALVVLRAPGLTAASVLSAQPASRV